MEDKAKALRVLSLCHMGLQEYTRAGECVNLAHQVCGSIDKFVVSSLGSSCL